jgi:hypothetical protein
MSSNKIPIGQLFSHVYCDRGSPSKDSELFRRRIGTFCNSNFSDESNKLGTKLVHEIGLEVPSIMGVYKFDEFFFQIDLKHMLNAITLVWRIAVELNKPYVPASANKWYAFVKRALHEENMGYYLDDSCGVHYLVDEEFERNRISLLSCLQDDKYSGVKAAFEDAHRHLDSSPQDTKASVRSMFESLEILVRQMVNTSNLNKWVAENPLKQLAIEAYKNDSTAVKVIDSVFEGFGKWIEGMHNYRHGQGLPEPVAPSVGFAIFVLSSGASYLRWLVEIDTLLKNNKI